MYIANIRYRIREVLYMHQDVKEILYTQEQLATRVRELGAASAKIMLMILLY